MLTAEQIKANAGVRKPVEIVVPEWGGSVYARRMASGQVNDLTEKFTSQRDLMYTLLLESLVSEDGERLFTDDDRAFLESEPFDVILAVFMAAAKANGLPVGQVEEAMQDFGNGQAAYNFTA